MNQIQKLTVDQVKKAGAQNKFIAFRHSDGSVVGINTGIMKFRQFSVLLPTTRTKFVSYYPISFMEYITIKIPFVC